MTVLTVTTISSMKRHEGYFTSKKSAAACSSDMCYLCKNLHITSHNKSTSRQYAPW